VVKDPDRQVQHVIELVLSKFAELGSARQVLRYLKQEEILPPRRHCAGPQAGELFWKPPTDYALCSILHNPAYAGAFAYGRRQMEPSLRQPQRPGAGRLHRPLEQWHHLQQEVYPAYISWEQYLANQEKLRENSTLFEWTKQHRRVPAREGRALLQGLAVCGECGTRMRVSYKRRHRYQCEEMKRRVLGEMCASLQGATLDEAVVEAFFEALGPAQLELLEGVLEAQAAEEAKLEQHWQEQLGRAGYEVRLAERQYNAADPDNRLVTGELERRWEEKLQMLRQAQEQYARFQQRTRVKGLRAEQRAEFEQLSERLPKLWENLTLVE
jgi:hypothetical protein